MMVEDFKPEDVEWCELCRSHRPGNQHCDGCGLTFEETDQKYKSQSFHYHPAAIAGVMGTVAINKLLCVDCYRKDHKAVYPKIDVPPLPDRGMDPKFFGLQQLQKRRQEVKALLDQGRSRPLTDSEASMLQELAYSAIR